MSDSTCSIFFRSGAGDLAKAARILDASAMLKAKRSGDTVKVSGHPEGPSFEITLHEGLDVKELAIEISSDTEHADAMSQCDARFGLEIPDLDAALDEINTLIEVQSLLQDATRGYLFTGWNQSVMEPWMG